jgi:pyruvate dehydrogenase E1 component alpha subunit
MMAELYGREAGYCKGKGGSMHIADFEIGMLGANGIVAGGISIITGAALAAQLDAKEQVAVGFFGDGASNAGPFHESLNIASAWKLPVVYVCENNQWAVNTPASASVSVPNVADRAPAYGLPGLVVDGNDVLAVYEAASAAVARARAGGGPTLIECKTYRHRRHTERPTQQDDRPADEVAAWLGRDPIERLAGSLRAQQGQLDDAEWEAMDAEILRTIEAAVAFAEASPVPAPEAALDDVYAD